MSTQRKAEHRHNPNSALAIKAKLKATFRSARLLVLLYGSVGLVGCVVVTMLLCGWLHLNPYATFAGSVVSFVILAVTVLPMKSVWKSKLIMAYQEEHLFDLANELGFKDIGKQVAEILDDKHPIVVSDLDHFILRITDLRLLFIRQGQMRKARRLSQYLCRQQPDHSYHVSCLASINNALGYFDEAIELALKNIDNLSSDVRTASPSAATSYLCLISTNLDLHRTAEAEKWLDKLKQLVETKDHSTESNIDRIVRIECNTTEVDAAFYSLYLGRFQMLAKQTGARENIMKAEKFMSIEENQKRLQLLYPFIMLSLGQLSMREGDYKAALAKFAEATKLYEATPFRGPDYHESCAFAAYCKWKNSGSNVVDQIASSIRFLEDEVQPNHPRLAMLLVLLGEAQMRLNAVKAKEAYEKAHAIYSTQYPAGDSDTRDLEERLASLAA